MRRLSVILMVSTCALVGCGVSVSETPPEDKEPSTTTIVEGLPTTEPTETSTSPDTSTQAFNTEAGRSAADERFARRVKKMPLQSPVTTVGFGLGSPWFVDLGSYECDDAQAI